MSRVAAPSRPGLTLIEVVIATVTLVIASAAVFSGMSFVANLAVRDRKRLEAVEVAHRVILQQMEDPDQLAGQARRTAMGPNYYAFEMDEMLLTEDESGQLQAGKPVKLSTHSFTDASGTDKLKTRLNMLTVRVYEDNDNQGPAGKPPLAELTRIYNWINGDQDSLMQKLQRRFGKELDNASLGAPGAPTPAPGR